MSGSKLARAAVVCYFWLTTAAWAQGVQPPIIPPSGSITPLNNTWSGINTYTNGVIFNSTLAYGGVTLSPSVTGTGSMVLSVSPTLIGTVTLNSPATADPVVTSNAQLSVLPSTSSPSIWRVGFTSTGDSPPSRFISSGSACSLNAGAGDGGSQVPSSDGKCWLAVFGAAGADFRQWGAQPNTNVDTAFDAATAWACASHIPLLIPYQGQIGPYLLNASHSIGNGSATQNSTCNAIPIDVTQPLTAAAAGLDAIFKFNGTGAGTIPIIFQGPMTDVHVSGINVNCANICNTGLEFVNLIDSDIGWIGVEDNCGLGVIVTSLPTNIWLGGMEGSRIHDVQVAFPTCAGGGGMQVGALASSGGNFATIANQFDNVTLNYDANHSTSCGILFGLADQNTLTNLRVAPYPGTSGSGNAICITPPTGATTFPTDITFNHPLITGPVQDPGASWTGTWGFNVISWALNASAFPTSVDLGLWHGIDNLNHSYPTGTCALTDGSGASLTITTTACNWTKNGGYCTVSFEVAYPSTANGSVAKLAGLPCVVAGVNSVDGTFPSFSTLATAFSILAGATTSTMQFYTLGGSSLTNATLSTINFRGTITYQTSN